jgi:tellurite resistance protein TehA-like permease
VIAAAVFVWAAPRLARSNRQASFAGIALLLVVAVESLAEVAARLSADWTGAALADLALALWLSGVVLYALLVVRVGPALWPARSPDSITPDWWIVMGALSIVTVSGGWVFMQVDTAIAPSLLLATWIGATLWLPLLAVAEVRRTRRIRPFWRYQPGAWSAVFPIGMYALACSWVGTLEGVGALRVVSQIGLGVGVAAWSLTVVGGAQPRFRPGALSPGLVEQRPGNQPGSDSS